MNQISDIRESKRCRRVKSLPINNRPTAGWGRKLEFAHLPATNVPIRNRL